MEWVLIAIVFFGLLFDYTNGFHDSANVVATVIATRVLTPLAAIGMASLLNFIGATQISGVAETIATGIVDAKGASQIGVLGALMGAIVWNIFTWYYGIPSSSSHALIGGLVGAAWAQGGAGMIEWHGVFQKVFLPMIFSPLLGFFIGLLSMRCLNSSCSGSKKIFRHLQIGSAGFVALSHGLNDAQKSMGIITLGLFAAGTIPEPTIPFWVILSCALVIGLGTASGGFRIIHTMGFSITKIDPMQGFAAETSAALVILAASLLGMPVSSTHVIAGGITGVGASKGRSFVEWKTPRKMVLAWILTLPGSAALGWLCFTFLS